MVLQRNVGVEAACGARVLPERGVEGFEKNLSFVHLASVVGLLGSSSEGDVVESGSLGRVEQRALLQPVPIFQPPDMGKSPLSYALWAGSFTAPSVKECCSRSTSVVRIFQRL